MDRYKYPERHPEYTESTYRDLADRDILAPLNERLQNHSYLRGETPGLADMAISPFIRQFAQVDRAWWDDSELGALRRWLQALTGSELFEAASWRKPDAKASSAGGQSAIFAASPSRKVAASIEKTGYTNC